ncbi:hypothetical protein HUG15_04285 [Salicibibacter cibarius]|uniref:Uncharacterized protein n=1 Tax=Salicibibacter cibarius TaxID=2743000 RepID=A0A7T7CAH2_9BACI|nr:hypothetical protein [Salicibibacter cibarius]QQK74897.1 hypothetical protein HUG15_04285 [Salicibibacter cibarius]
MKTFWQTIKNYSASPIFTPTIDRFIGLEITFTGAFLAFYLGDQIPFWQLLIVFACYCRYPISVDTMVRKEMETI